MKRMKWPLAALLVSFSLLIPGCVFDTSETEEADPPPAGMVWLQVKVPQKDSRTLSESVSKSSVDYYELYARDRGTTATTTVAGSCPVSSASAYEGYVLRIAVRPDHYYDFLLLSGESKTKTLLSSCFINKRDIDDPEFVNGGYDSTAPGVLISKNSTIMLDMRVQTWVTSDPLNDFSVFYTPSAIGSTQLVKKPVVGSSINASNKADYTDVYVLDTAPLSNPFSSMPIRDGLNTAGVKVEIKTMGLLPLIRAEASSTADVPTFGNTDLSLKAYLPSSENQTFPAIGISSPDSVENETTGSGSDEDQGVKITYTIPKNQWPENDGLYGRLSYSLDYQPFDDSNSSLWHIRNGFDPRDWDSGKNPNGGGIVVIIGNDPKNFVPDSLVEITY